MIKTPLGYEQFATPTLSAAASLTVPDGAEFALIQAVTQNVRWRDDGTTPDATTGNRIIAGQTLDYRGNLATFEMIEETASAEVNVSYYA